MEIKVPTHPFTKLGRTMESAMRKALYEFDLIPSDGKIAVALSGGKDSLTLLFLLKAISGRGFPELDIHAVHVGGEFTCGAGVTTSFLQKICDSMGVPLHIRQSTKTLETLECYSCSRERRTMLFDEAKKHGIQTIAFGHTKDDNVETTLMNLLHKGEFCGMLPKIWMADYDITIVRPLIFIDEASIRTFGEQNQYLRVTCRCPVGVNSMRRKTENLLKDIEALYPNARENLASAVIQYGSKKALREQ